jgi:hypothetical protein
LPVDRELLETALVGYGGQKKKLGDAIAEIRRELGGNERLASDRSPERLLNQYRRTRPGVRFPVSEGI